MSVIINNGSGVINEFALTHNYANKNKIINGDMSITQRGRFFKFENNGDYTADRWYSEVQNGIECIRQEKIWSKNEGTWKNETDPFGDGSQHNLWQFDGNADDTNGNNNGTLHGDANFIDDYLPGIGACKVLNLDGSGDYVSTDFKIDNSDKYTLSLWLKTDNLATGYPKVLWCSDPNGTNTTFRGGIGFSNNRELRFSMGDGNNFDNINIYNTPTLDDNIWHNIIIAINGYKQVCYVDSKKILEETLSVSAGTAGDYTYSIGRQGEDDVHYFQGQVARARIIQGKALTQEEVYKLYVEDNKYIQQKQLRSIILNDNSISTYKPFVYRFEGQDLIDYKNEKVTISFNIRSNQTGDFSLSLINQSTDDKQSYVTKFNYSKDDKTFQKAKITIPLSDFDKFIKDNEELGFELVIAGIGSETQTKGIQNGEYFYLKDTIKLSTNDWVAITDVQLEVGNVATDFERISYDSQLEKCLRYYEAQPFISAVRSVKVSDTGSTETDYWQLKKYFRKEKRTTPQINATFSRGDISYPYDRITTKFWLITDNQNGFEVYSYSVDAEL